MELLQLKYFCDSATTENFSQTAKKFGVPPSDVSQSIRRLERELGVGLFIRRANSIGISEYGREFYARASKALSLLEEAKAILKEAGLNAEYQDDPTLMITAQVPAANEQVQKNTDVLLYTEATNVDISETVQELVTVPDVVGKTRLAANDALAAKGLTIRIEPEDQTGTAIRQVPAAGEQVPVGTEVLVEFSHIELLTQPDE